MVGATKVYPLVKVEAWLSVLVTTTSTAPSGPFGVMQVIEVDETTFTLVQANPHRVTEAPARKPVPLIVIVVPPPMWPVAGEIPVMCGPATKLNPPV
jgi:hypothetical protein